MKVLVASSSLVAKPVVDWLVGSSHSLVGVLTAPDAPKGRGQQVSENDFAHLAHSYSIPVFKARNNEEIRETIEKTQADIVITAAYGRMIREPELTQPHYGWLNIHFSLLPRWRGASPVQRAIENDDPVTGVTVFRLDKGMDTGPIYSSSSYAMQGDESTTSLLRALSELSVTTVVEALEKIENGVPPTAQSESGITLAPKISKDEGKINWRQSSSEIERKVRAFSPWPTAWSLLNDSRISIISARTSTLSLSPGEIFVKDGVLVGCGVGSLELLEVKAEGKRAMPAMDWLRGARINESAHFE